MKTLLLLLIPWALIGCEFGDSTPRNVGGWKRIGAVGDGGGDCSVYTKVNEETGERIYVAVGYNKCGIHVVPASPSK